MARPPQHCDHGHVASEGAVGSRYPVIEAWLREQCASLPAGSALPTETEVAEQFSVSRMTARRAFQRLAEQGLLQRKRGSGSFVLAAPLHRPEALIRPFTEDMRARGITPSSKVLRAEMGTAPEAAIALGLAPTEWVVLIKRVRYADGVPVCIDTTTLPGEFSAVLDADLEHGSLYQALIDLGRTMSRSSGYVTARLATHEEATLLEVPLPSALLVETRLILDSVDKPVETTQSAFVGSRWVIDIGAFVARADSGTTPSTGK